GETFRLDNDRPKSIGKVRGYTGPFGVFVRSYAYIRSYGPGLREMSETAVLNANYLLARLKDTYDLPFDRLCMHEFVLSARSLKKEHGVSALDVAKRLMDYGFHPPTIYFPLIVPEALMIEPTETEAKETLDAFVDAMLAIAREAADEPETVPAATTTSRSRPSTARSISVSRSSTPPTCTARSRTSGSSVRRLPAGATRSSSRRSSATNGGRTARGSGSTGVPTTCTRRAMRRS